METHVIAIVLLALASVFILFDRLARPVYADLK